MNTNDAKATAIYTKSGFDKLTIDDVIKLQNEVNEIKNLLVQKIEQDKMIINTAIEQFNSDNKLAITNGKNLYGFTLNNDGTIKHITKCDSLLLTDIIPPDDIENGLYKIINNEFIKDLKRLKEMI